MGDDHPLRTASLRDGETRDDTGHAAANAEMLRRAERERADAEARSMAGDCALRRYSDGGLRVLKLLPTGEERPLTRALGREEARRVATLLEEEVPADD